MHSRSTRLFSCAQLSDQGELCRPRWSSATLGKGTGLPYAVMWGGGAEEGQATARAKEKGVLQSQLLGTAAGILQPRKFKVSLGKTGKKKSSQKRRERS